MSTEFFLALQQLARSVQAIHLPIARLAELVARNTTFDKVEVIRQLRKESVQKELALNWETLVCRHVTGNYVLICTALPDNQKDAQILATRRLINSRDACSFCGLVEGSLASIELTVAVNPVGIPIQGERVHPRCSLYWTRLKLIADCAPRRESLL